MTLRALIVLPVLLGAGAAGCGGGGSKFYKGESSDTGVVDVDEDPPVIEHIELPTQTFGQAVDVTCTVTDAESAVARVTLYYRRADVTEWTELAMQSTGGDGYGAQIPGIEVAGSGMNYYLAAEDEIPNLVLSPIEGANGPYYFRVSAD